MQRFAPVPKQPDHIALEHAALDRWQREGTFEQLRDQNRGGPTYSFFDGPITANNPMGVHHAWGRTLKDVWQRYHAMLGSDQRYQNGFDCQGLWVEVEVEKALGLNSKPEIEEYGLDRFARACRDRVAKYAGVQTAAVDAAGPVDGLGPQRTSRCPTRTSATSGASSSSATSAAGCTRAIARCRGARAAAPRSPSTS